ncbi:LLM class flavin-dependent oxidoreductase [Luteolibacter luteus]|uniref:Luciferase-like monooxygenase n=1 Tax=Luteolibacter luteus TaxID=2728835 RepID=A0A858RH69_9BACT|nr:LLM class flavin-dependent oxidoreductase [Luteolibacter luteus]QJE95894.1 LLM class flavin-dependent oxidoreductase [Luteolibacter luteus]
MKLLSEIPLSVLDLSPIVEGGTISESFRNSVDLAQHVEKLGYTRFWLAEHHNIPGIASAATSVLIGHVAAGTSTLRIGSGGIMLPNHAPLIIAEQFGTLEALYPGRIDLGLGRAPGTDQTTSRALRRDPTAADDFPDQVQELIALLGRPNPAQRVKAIPGMNSHVPVWLLGSSTFSAQLAAFLGLPFAFAAHFAPRLLHQALKIYRDNFQPSERWPEPHAMVGVPVIAADSDEEARHLSTSVQQQILNLIRHAPTPVPPPIPSLDGRWSPQEKAAVMDHLGALIIGGPETVKSKLEEFVASTGADELIIHSGFYRHEDRRRSYEIVAQAAGLPRVTVPSA